MNASRASGGSAAWSALPSHISSAVQPAKAAPAAATTPSGWYRVDSAATMNWTFSPGSTASWARNATTTMVEYSAIGQRTLPERVTAPTWDSLASRVPRWTAAPTFRLIVKD